MHPRPQVKEQLAQAQNYAITQAREHANALAAERSRHAKELRAAQQRWDAQQAEVEALRKALEAAGLPATPAAPGDGGAPSVPARGPHSPPPLRAQSPLNSSPGRKARGWPVAGESAGGKPPGSSPGRVPSPGRQQQGGQGYWRPGESAPRSFLG